MRFLPGVPFQTRNVNRTSVPGLVANEIVPPPRGMRSMSSAFRHFSDGARVCRQTTRLFGSSAAALVIQVASRLRHTRAPFHDPVV